MILPNDEECRRVLSELEDEPSLSQWESEFIDSNCERWSFTDAQKEVITRLLEKYEV